LERPASERQAFLEAACSGDVGFMLEVQRMLAAEDQTSSLLDGASMPVAPTRSGQCPGCKAEIAISHQYCPFCGTPAEPVRRADGRFRAGALFANRFRIVGLLGRGGMGEVYRAQDLELDQPVALKFLTAVRHDERARSRLRSEVRLARQVSHANVCRVYDIGEAQGESYLSMEYVDGEDLGALLRRIGKLPVDKAVEIALRLSDGLAAAHAKGVLHRDLKPANIMIDSSGAVRIMDFGLAAIAGDIRGTLLQEGTPFYMAPEQLAGQKVSVQSDIYSLGLVFYEMLTGKPPFEGNTPGELRRLREESRVTPPASLVADLEPAVERAILRCLDPDPRKRPASALGVAALLPGGDPLARALAAGETPSPETIVAAGSTEPVRPAVAVLLLLGIAVGMAAIWLTAPRVQMLNSLSLESPPEVRTARAQEILRSLGYTNPPADSASGFRFEEGYVEYMTKKVVGEEQWKRALSLPPSPLTFWYRQSPESLLPTASGGWWEPVVLRLRPDDPLTTAGTVSLGLDMKDRLVRFSAQPEPDRASSATGDEPRVPDWSPLFAAAGLDAARFKPTGWQNAPPLAMDARAAWNGTYVEQPDVQLRVEAGSFLGRIVYFDVATP
jgi:serine/threonine-protein kinase